jgi:hypothetical protein
MISIPCMTDFFLFFTKLLISIRRCQFFLFIQGKLCFFILRMLNLYVDLFEEHRSSEKPPEPQREHPASKRFLVRGHLCNPDPNPDPETDFNSDSIWIHKNCSLSISRFNHPPSLLFTISDYCHACKNMENT